MSNEISESLERLRQVYRVEDLIWDLDILTELPPFADVVTRFISERAKRDLPETQFRGELREPRDYVEIAGTLGYSPEKGIEEIEYYHPDSSEVVFKDGEFEVVSSGSSAIFVFKFEGIPHIIDFHSHPDGDGSPAIRDTLRWRDLCQGAGIVNPDGSFHNVIYLPEQDKLFWYVLGEDHGRAVLPSLS